MKPLEEVIEKATTAFNERLGGDFSIKEREMYLTSYLFGWLQAEYKREYEKQHKPIKKRT